MNIMKGILSGSERTIVPVSVSPTGALYFNEYEAQGQPYVKFLTSSGDGTGNNNLNGNYIAPTDFFYTIPTGKTFAVHSLTVQVSDETTFNQTDYGGIAGGLTNGIGFFLNSNGVDVPLLAAQIVKLNYEWARITPNIGLTQWSGTPQTLIVDLNVIEGFGMPLILSSITNDKFIVRLNDNFSGLISHTFALRGVIYPSEPQKRTPNLQD